MEDRNLDHAQLDLLLLHGRKGKAAELQLSEGRIIEAIDLFLEDDDDASMSRAKEIILQNLWHLTPFGVTLIKRDKVKELLDRSERITVDENDREEVGYSSSSAYFLRPYCVAVALDVSFDCR